MIANSTFSQKLYYLDKNSNKLKLVLFRVVLPKNPVSAYLAERLWLRRRSKAASV